MHSRLARLLLGTFALVLIVIGVIVYDSTKKDVNASRDKLHVTVTTTFLGDVVEQVASEHVEVTRLMGPGVDPHQYQASSSDLMKLTSADLVLYGGLHLEAKLGDVLEQLALAGSPIVNTSKDIPRNRLMIDQETENESKELADGTFDPHIWFDIDLWRIVVRTITDTLKQYDSVHAEIYETNAERYNEELTALAHDVKAKVTELPESARYLVSAHDAFNYFGRYTGIEVHGIQGMNTTVEAGTNDVSETANLILEHEIKAIFIESSVSPKLIQALQEAVVARGWHVAIGGELFSDSTGARGTLEGTYIGMYRHNIETIVNALK